MRDYNPHPTKSNHLLANTTSPPANLTDTRASTASGPPPTWLLRALRVPTPVPIVSFISAGATPPTRWHQAIPREFPVFDHPPRRRRA